MVEETAGPVAEDSSSVEDPPESGLHPAFRVRSPLAAIPGVSDNRAADGCIIRPASARITVSSTSRTSRPRGARLSGARRPGALVGAALILGLTLLPVAPAVASATAGSATRSIDIPDTDIDTGGGGASTPPDEGSGSTPPSDPAVDPEPTTDTPTTPSEPAPPAENEAVAPVTGETGSSGAGSSSGRSSGSRAGSGSGSSDPSPVEATTVPAPAAGTPTPTAAPASSPSPGSTQDALLPRVTLSGPLDADPASSGPFSGTAFRIVLGTLAAALLAAIVAVIVRRRSQRDPAAAGAEAWSSPSDTAVFSSPLPVSEFPSLASWRLPGGQDSASASAGAGLGAAMGSLDLSTGHYRRAEPPDFFTEGTADDGHPPRA